jgi:hypothetical protein
LGILWKWLIVSEQIPEEQEKWGKYVVIRVSLERENWMFVILELEKFEMIYKICNGSVLIDL